MICAHGKLAAYGCWHMPGDGVPAWLQAWQGQHCQPQPAVPATLPPSSAPKPSYAPRDTFAFPAREGADLQGMIEPKRWDFDGCLRREPVLDADARPPRVVRKVGWHRCLKCRRPFFSEDVLRLRMCEPCRGQEDRYTVLK